jgi:hypothetical protein
MRQDPVPAQLTSPEQLNRWVSPDLQSQLVERLTQRVGLTYVRSQCFVRLWIYLLIKQYQSDPAVPNGGTTPPLPLETLPLPIAAISCTHREAAALFYHDQDQGSDRAAGMMLDKLAALGLIAKHFDGNTTRITIYPIAELTEVPKPAPSTLTIDTFDPRCDAIPVANLLATNYNWMNRNHDAVPHRISRLLRHWAQQYGTGMRVLRRCDNLNPVGFYLLYPTASASDANFFGPPSKGLHLSAMSEQDPFEMATPGDLTCISVFIRSWMIEAAYLEQYRRPFLQDAQQTLRQMQQDFPNLCDLHTLIIHPQYETMATMLGFQKNSQHDTSSLYWMYLALDRFLALDL